MLVMGVRVGGVLNGSWGRADRPVVEAATGNHVRVDSLDIYFKRIR